MQDKSRIIKLDSKGKETSGFKTPESVPTSHGYEYRGFAQYFDFFENNKILTHSSSGLYLLESNGQLDTSFNTIFYPETRVKPGIQSSQKFIISIRDNLPDNSTLYHLARFNSNGEIDSTFEMGPGSTMFLWSLVVLPNDELIVNTNAWLELEYNGVFNKFGIYKLDVDGKVDTVYNNNLKKSPIHELPFSYLKGFHYKDNSLLFTYVGPGSIGSQLIGKVDSLGNMDSEFKLPSDVKMNFTLEESLNSPVWVGEKNFLLIGDFEVGKGKKQTKGLLFSENKIPAISGPDSIFSIPEDSSLMVSYSDFVIQHEDDSDTKNFTFKIISGENFTVTDNVIYPDSNFNGTLTVPNSGK
ncbi:MAG: hypothetical protein KTR26_13035 [Flammeovirgaceae bacterium]|nr:hypothetical protein [Flammeovirgaceae bacterium]